MSTLSTAEHSSSSMRFDRSPAAGAQGRGAHGPTRMQASRGRTQLGAECGRFWSLSKHGEKVSAAFLTTKHKFRYKFSKTIFLLLLKSMGELVNTYKHKGFLSVLFDLTIVTVTLRIPEKAA